MYACTYVFMYIYYIETSKTENIKIIDKYRSKGSIKRGINVTLRFITISFQIHLILDSKADLFLSAVRRKMRSRFSSLTKDSAIGREKSVRENPSLFADA